MTTMIMTITNEVYNVLYDSKKFSILKKGNRDQK